MRAELGWGVIGTGTIARKFTKDLRTTGHHVAGVGSRTEAGAERFGAEFEIDGRYSDYRRMLEDPSVDVAYIASPHPFHYEHAIAAIERGKHVLIEKPLGLNVRQVQDVFEKAAERGVVAMEAMWTRCLPHMEEVRATIAKGAIGGIRAVLADHTQSLPQDPSHRINDPALGGGSLLDLGVYNIWLTLDLLGAPQSFEAVGVLGATGVDTQVALGMSYESGAVASLTTSSVVEGPNEAVILGDGGSIHIDRIWYMPTGFVVRDRLGEVVKRYANGVETSGMDYEAREIERLIREGVPEGRLIPHSDSLEAMAIMDDVRKKLRVRYPGE